MLAKNLQLSVLKSFGKGTMEGTAAGTPREQPPPPSSRRTHKKRRGASAPLTADEADQFVRARAAANGAERISLKGRELDGPAAVRAVCDAILAFSTAYSRPPHATPIPVATTTLNLVRVQLESATKLCLKCRARENAP
jgi:hypothetical protein